MQPLLLLKQTLEATYDPGPLLLNGPNVLFTDAEQMFSRGSGSGRSGSLTVGIGIGETGISTRFGKNRKNGLEIRAITYSTGDVEFTLHQKMDAHEIIGLFPREVEHARYLPNFVAIDRDRCFLEMKIAQTISGKLPPNGVSFTPNELAPIMLSGMIKKVMVELLRGLIHLPGLRGNPERTYPVTAVGGFFPGTFEKYAASVIAQWQASKQSAKIEELSNDLERLGLTWKVTASSVSDTQVEIQVGRLASASRGRPRDLVNIADVGFGLSQTLPVVVSLRAAEPGQLVYLEQPEIHLHPRAQTAMAQILADAAKRGVRVVAETHSSLLLMGIQTLVAEGELSPELVKLHWFRRRDDGSTMIESADLDEAGAFGDWPEDFAEADLSAQSRYLDAAEARLRVH